MSEIEKAREAAIEANASLAARLVDIEMPQARAIAAAIKDVVDAQIVLAREEIEAAGPWVCGACGAVPSPTCPHRGVIPQCGVLVRATDNQEGGEANSREDQASTRPHNSPPAVEAPAAGVMPRGEFDKVADAMRLAGTTVLARRLAEALAYLVGRCEYKPSGPKYAAMLSTQGGRERKALADSHAALDEARKHKLIE